MFPRERRKQIIEMLRRDGTVKVDDLAKHFDVSVDSIRKDLRELAQEGICRREYGGAIYLGTPKGEEAAKNYAQQDDLSSQTGKSANFNLTARQNYSLDTLSSDDLGRLMVARRAFMEINDGDSVFLDISRTNLFLADCIAAGNKHVIVTTNMIEIMPRLSDNPKVTALATGGYLNMQLNGFIGTATISLLEPLLFSKAFIGTHGVDIETEGCFVIEPDDGLVKRQVIQNASYKFLLADSQKFYQRGNYRFASLTDFSAVISDTQDSEVIQNIARKGVPLLRC